MRFTAVLTVVACLISVGAQAAEAAPEKRIAVAPEKRAEILRLIGLTGDVRLVTEITDAAAENLTRALRRGRTDNHERALAIVKRELSALLKEEMDKPGGLVERIVAIYDKHFTLQELNELVRFYATPTGRKAAAVTPHVIAAGQAWGASLGREMRQRVDAALQKEGLAPRPSKK